MAKGVWRDSPEIPVVAKEPYYPVLEHPFLVLPVQKEVFYDNKKILHLKSRESAVAAMLKAMRKSHLLRIRFFIYLCKVGTILESALNDMDTTGQCDLAGVRKCIDIGGGDVRNRSRDDSHFEIITTLNTSILQVRACLQGLVATSAISALGNASSSLPWKKQAKIPKKE